MPRASAAAAIHLLGAIAVPLSAGPAEGVLRTGLRCSRCSPWRAVVQGQGPKRKSALSPIHLLRGSRFSFRTAPLTSDPDSPSCALSVSSGTRSEGEPSGGPHREKEKRNAQHLEQMDRAQARRRNSASTGTSASSAATCDSRLTRRSAPARSCAGTAPSKAGEFEVPLREGVAGGPAVLTPRGDLGRQDLTVVSPGSSGRAADSTILTLRTRWSAMATTTGGVRKAGEQGLRGLQRVQRRAERHREQEVNQRKSGIPPDQALDVRVLLYCFKPPSPRAAAPPPPRGRSGRRSGVNGHFACWPTVSSRRVFHARRNNDLALRNRICLTR